MSEKNHFTENIVGIMDDFISHLNKTKKLFMILILSSFIVAPLSLIFAFILITPQVLTQAGEPYVVSLSAPGIVYDKPQLTLSRSNFTPPELQKLNDSEAHFTFEVVTITDENVPTLKGVMRAIPSTNNSVVFHKIVSSVPESQNHTGSVWVTQDDVTVRYFPLKSFDVQKDAELVTYKVGKFVPSQPKFMFVSDPGQIGKQFDVTPFIFVMVIISSILASFWIYVGIREYKFFANWNKKYGNYKKLQEKIDQELGD